MLMQSHSDDSLVLYIELFAHARPTMSHPLHGVNIAYGVQCTIDLLPRACMQRDCMPSPFHVME